MVERDVQADTDFWNIASMRGVFESLFNTIVPNDGTGIMWNPQNAGGGAAFALWRLVSTPWFAWFARAQSRLTTELNAYAKTAVKQMGVFAMGPGFEYTSTVAAVQERLDKFEKANRWRRKSIQYFRNYLRDGEVFFELFPDEFKVRWVDPDLIHGDDEKQYLRQGVQYSDGDQLEPESYLFHKYGYLDQHAGEPGEAIPAELMQHRANKDYDNQPRGFPWLLPVLKDLALVDPLGTDLLASARVLAKVAVLRKWKSPQVAVQAIQTAFPGWQNALGPGPKAEHHVPGEIIDTNFDTEWKILESQDYAQFAEIVDLVLRKVSAICYLSPGVFSGDKSDRGAYASEIVHSSWAQKAIQSLQNTWKDWDLELFEKMGIDPDKVEVTVPQVGEPEKRSETMFYEMSIKNKVFSRQYVCEKNNGDWEQERARIKAETAEFGDPDESADGEPGEGRGGVGSEPGGAG